MHTLRLLFLSNSVNKWLVKSNIASEVPRPGLTPYWALVSRLLRWRWLSMCLWINFSRSLPGTGSRLIGLQLLILFRRPAFGIGTTVLTLQASGKEPSFREFLKMDTIWGTRMVRASFSTVALTQSIPLHLLVLMPSTSFSTSSREISKTSHKYDSLEFWPVQVPLDLYVSNT